MCIRDRDGIGHIVPFFKEKLGEKVNFKTFGQKKSILSRFSAQIFGDIGHSIEERAAYARFGM